jgi:hypothetical protein
LRRCRASLSYADGSSSDGALAIVVFVDGRASILRMVFGCMFSASPNGVTSARQWEAFDSCCCLLHGRSPPEPMLPSMTPLLNGGGRGEAVVQGRRSGGEAVRRLMFGNANMVPTSRRT